VTIDSNPQATAGLHRLECPRCHSDDVIRSRRKFWERFVLVLVAAHVHRCRDCKHRFWVGMQWKRLVLASVAVAFVAGIALTVLLLIQTRTPPQPVARPRLRRRRLPPLPRGLPPLSQVPRPRDEPTTTGAPASH